MEWYHSSQHRAHIKNREKATNGSMNNCVGLSPTLPGWTAERHAGSAGIIHSAAYLKRRSWRRCCQVHCMPSLTPDYALEQVLFSGSNLFKCARVPRRRRAKPKRVTGRRQQTAAFEPGAKTRTERHNSNCLANRFIETEDKGFYSVPLKHTDSVWQDARKTLYQQANTYSHRPCRNII